MTSKAGLPLARSLRLGAGYAVRRLAWSRRTVVLLLLALAPLAFAMVVRSEAPPGAIDLFRTGFLPNLSLGILHIFFAFLATGLVRDGIEDRTLTFLLTRPMGRAPVVFGLYGGLLLLAVPLLLASALLGYLACFAGTGTRPLPMDDPACGTLLLAVGLAALFYGALYTLIGMVFRSPAIAAIIYLIAVEIVLGSLKGPPRTIVPSAWFENLLVGQFATRVQWGGDPASGGGLTTILIVYGAMLLLIRWRARTMDFMASSKDS